MLAATRPPALAGGHNSALHHQVPHRARDRLASRNPYAEPHPFVGETGSFSGRRTSAHKPSAKPFCARVRPSHVPVKGKTTPLCDTALRAGRGTSTRMVPKTVSAYVREMRFRTQSSCSANSSRTKAPKTRKLRKKQRFNRTVAGACIKGGTHKKLSWGRHTECLRSATMQRRFQHHFVFRNRRRPDKKVLTPPTKVLPHIATEYSTSHIYSTTEFEIPPSMCFVLFGEVGTFLLVRPVSPAIIPDRQR